MENNTQGQAPKVEKISLKELQAENQRQEIEEVKDDFKEFFDLFKSLTPEEKQEFFDSYKDEL